MWVRSFSTRLTSVTFAEDMVLIFLILQCTGLTARLTRIASRDVTKLVKICIR